MGGEKKRERNKCYFFFLWYIIKKVSLLFRIPLSCVMGLFMSLFFIYIKRSRKYTCDVYFCFTLPPLRILYFQFNHFGFSSSLFIYLFAAVLHGQKMQKKLECLAVQTKEDVGFTIRGLSKNDLFPTLLL